MQAMQKPPAAEVSGVDGSTQHVSACAEARSNPANAQGRLRLSGKRHTTFERHIARIADAMLSIDMNQRSMRRRLDDLYHQRGNLRRASRKGDNGSEDRLMELHKEIKQLRNSLLKPGLRDASGFSRIPDYSLDHLVATKLDHAVLDLLREPAPRQLQSLARVLSESQEAPSIKSFNIMISRLTRLRQNAAAWVIFQSMLKLGYRPDEYTIASILNLCIVTGNYLAFRKVLAAARLQQAARYRKRRNLLFFSTAIKGFCKFGHLRHAETYYKLMIWEGNRPAPIILTCMLHGFANQGAWESGRPYFELLLRQPWDRLTVVTLLRYCNACKQPLAAERIRALALKKGTVLGPGEQDLAQMPPGWKTKGLDVPDGMKIPGLSDLGLQQKIQWHQRNEPEPQVTKRAWRYWHIGKWKRKA